MNPKGPYSRVYWSVVDDPDFDGVYDNDRLLATWLRLLIHADATYPMSAPLPAKTAAVRELVSRGLVVERFGGRYTVRGLAAERERRAQSGRIGAAVRWQNERNANAMLDETRRDKTSRDGAKAPKPGSHEGQHPNCLVCERVSA